MRPDLAALLDSAAGLLDSAGMLEPLHIVLGGQDIQITFAPGVPMADQRVSVDRLAAVAGTFPMHANLGATGATYSLSAELPDQVFLVAGTHPTINRPRPSRSTSTRAMSSLLRTLMPWSQVLTAGSVPVAELGVRDDEQRLSVHLLVETDGDPQAMLTKASAGMSSLRPSRGTRFGLGGFGRLPSGQPVEVSVM